MNINYKIAVEQDGKVSDYMSRIVQLKEKEEKTELTGQEKVAKAHLELSLIERKQELARKSKNLFANIGELTRYLEVDKDKLTKTEIPVARRLTGEDLYTYRLPHIQSIDDPVAYDCWECGVVLGLAKEVRYDQPEPPKEAIGVKIHCYICDKLLGDKVLLDRKR